MSIDARVTGISWPGTIARLTLDVHYPPLSLPTLLDREIWGGDLWLMCGDRRIGRRVGYSACELDNGALLDLPPKNR